MSDDERSWERRRRGPKTRPPHNDVGNKSEHKNSRKQKKAQSAMRLPVATVSAGGG